MTTTTIETAANNLRTHSERIERIDGSKPYEVPDSMAPGDMLAQGDIGMLMLDAVPCGATRAPWPQDGDLQLAPGASKGSRHCIPRRFASVVTPHRIDDGDPLSDTVLVATAPFDLTHPEHADHVGYPAGIYRVCHQQTAQRERVMD